MSDSMLLTSSVAIGLIPAFIARRKGHTFLGFWLMGAMFFIVALPWAIFIKRNPEVYRQCPYCREWVAREATACPHCGRDTGPPPPLGAPVIRHVPLLPGRTQGLVVFLWVLVAMAAVVLVMVMRAATA